LKSNHIEAYTSAITESPTAQGKRLAREEMEKKQKALLDEFKKNGKVSVATQLIGVTRAPQGNNKCELL
jgi:hypothetical protein